MFVTVIPAFGCDHSNSEYIPSWTLLRACILIHRVPAWCTRWCTLALGFVILERNFPSPGTCLSWRLYLAFLLTHLSFIDLGRSCPQSSSFLYLANNLSFPSPSLLSHSFFLSCLCVCGMHVCGHARMYVAGGAASSWHVVNVLIAVHFTDAGSVAESRAHWFDRSS